MQSRGTHITRWLSTCLCILLLHSITYTHTFECHFSFAEAAFPDTKVQNRQIGMNGLNHVNAGPIGPAAGYETLLMKILPTSNSSTLTVTIMNAVISNTIFWIESPENGKRVQLNMYMQNVQMIDSFFKIHRMRPAANFDTSLSNTYTIIIQSSVVLQRSAYIDNDLLSSSQFPRSTCQPAIALFYFQSDAEYPDSGGHYIEIANTVINLTEYNYTAAAERGYSTSNFGSSSALTYGTVDRAGGLTPNTIALAYFCSPIIVRGQIIVQNNVVANFLSLTPMKNIGMFGFAYLDSSVPSSSINNPTIKAGGVLSAQATTASFRNGCDYVFPDREVVGCNVIANSSGAPSPIFRTSFIFQSTSGMVAAPAVSTFQIINRGQLRIGSFSAVSIPQGELFGPTFASIVANGTNTEVQMSNVKLASYPPWPPSKVFLTSMMACSEAYVSIVSVNLTGYPGLFLAEAKSAGASFQVCRTTIGSVFYAYEESYDLMGADVYLTLCSGSPGRAIPPTTTTTTGATNEVPKRLGFKFVCAFALSIEDIESQQALIVSELARLAGVAEGNVEIVSIHAGSTVVEANIYEATEDGAMNVVVSIKSGSTSLASTLNAIASSLKITRITSNVALQQALVVLIFISILGTAVLVVVAIGCYIRNDFRQIEQAENTKKVLGMRRQDGDANSWGVDAFYDDDGNDDDAEGFPMVQKNKKVISSRKVVARKSSHIAPEDNMFSIVGGQLLLLGVPVSLCNSQAQNTSCSSGDGLLVAADVLRRQAEGEANNTGEMAQPDSSPHQDHHVDSNAVEGASGAFTHNRRSSAVPSSPTIRRAGALHKPSISCSSERLSSNGQSVSILESHEHIGGSSSATNKDHHQHVEIITAAAAAAPDDENETPSNNISNFFNKSTTSTTTSNSNNNNATSATKQSADHLLGSALYTDAMYDRVEVANAMWAEMSMPSSPSSDGGLQSPHKPQHLTSRPQKPLTLSPSDYTTEGGVPATYSAFADRSTCGEGTQQEVVIFVGQPQAKTATYQSIFPPILPRSSYSRTNDGNSASANSSTNSSSTPRSSQLPSSMSTPNNPNKVKKRVTIQELAPSSPKGEVGGNIPALPAVFMTGSRDEGTET